MREEQSLFRRQVLDFRQRADTRIAPILARARLSLWMSWLFAVNLAALLLLLLMLDYRSTASAPGILHGDGLTQGVMAPRIATIRRIHVREGARVEAGDVLVTLVSEAYDHEGDPEAQRLIAHLEEQRQLLRREADIERLRYAQAQNRRQQQLTGTRQQQRQLTRQLSLLRAQTDLVGDDLAALGKLLAQRAIPRSDYQRRQVELLAGQRELSEVERRRQELDQALSDLEGQQKLLETDHAAALLSLKKQSADIDHRLRATRHGHVTTLVAGQPGLVSTIVLDAGAVVRANQTVLYLRSPAQAMIAEVWAPSRVAARLATGQTLMLRLDAFDYRHYGRLPGVIRHVSRTPLDPREHLLPVSGTGQALFRIDVSLPDTGLWKDADLPPGTTLVADFVLEEKSLLAYILEPVLRLRGKVV